MASKKQVAGIAVALIIAIAATTYIFITPYMRIWGGDDLDGTLTGGVIIGESEPLRDWEVFVWTPR